jgi:hypothetical protein
MPIADACPPAEMLEAFLLGRLAEPEREQLAGHVLHCPGCVARLHTLRAEDVLVGAMRGGAESCEADSETRLIARLRARGPDGMAMRTVVDTGAPDIPIEVNGLLAPPETEGELGRLGGYRVLAVLGVGGMGVVFRAEDVVFQWPVALKVMLPVIAARPANRQRFLREARAAAAVEHERIVAIHHVGEDHGVPFLAMPLLKGESLEARLDREGRLPPGEVVRIGREIAEGLAAAHARGLIHRDVKPANVFLEMGNGEWGMGNERQPPSAAAADPSSHSPFPIPHWGGSSSSTSGWRAWPATPPA